MKKLTLLLLCVLCSSLITKADRTIVEEFDAKIVLEDESKEKKSEYTCWHGFEYEDKWGGTKKIWAVYWSWDREAKKGATYYNQNMHIKHYKGTDERTHWDYDYYYIDKISYLDHYSEYFRDYIVYEKEGAVDYEEYINNFSKYIERQ